MNNKILAYTILNVKSLFKDKIPFIWSILLPLIMLIISLNNVQHEKDITYWWVYMILCSYIYGVGVYALELKEEGCLRTIFSISNSSIVFFLGNLLTQIIFSFISISIFNITVVLLKGFSLFRITIYSIECILLCIPVAFFSYGLTLFRKIHANTIRTIFSIVIFGMLMLINTNLTINQYNPMRYISSFMIKSTVKSTINYIIFTAFAVTIGFVGIFCFNPNSNERR